MIVRLRLGWECVVIGPRAYFTGVITGAAPDGGVMASEYEARRRLTMALGDPGQMGELRRAFAQWRGDGHRLYGVGDREIVDQIARMTRHGVLTIFVVPDRAMKYGRADAALHGATPVAPPSDGVPVQSMTLRQRLEAVLRLIRAHPDRIPEKAQELVLGQLNDQAIGALATTLLSLLIGWAASHFVIIGEIADIALIGAAVFVGAQSVLEGVKKLVAAYRDLENAKSEQDLDAVAIAVLDAILAMGVMTFFRLLNRFGSKPAPMWGEKKPGLARAGAGAREKPAKPPIARRSDKSAGKGSAVTEPSERPRSPRRALDPRTRPDLDEKWVREDGSLRWPDGKEAGTLPDGFVKPPHRDVLEAGTRLDRYGAEEGGLFLSPAGTPYGARALPYDASKMPYNQYVVVKPLPVAAGRAAPWFDQPGGGVQYKSDMSIDRLIEEGYIVRRTP
jgi:hypothetical protein